MKQNPSKPFNTIIVVIAFTLSSMITGWLLHADEFPTYRINKDVVDTGKYVSSDEVFHVSELDDDDIGNHALIIGRPEDLHKKKKGAPFS